MLRPLPTASSMIAAVSASSSTPMARPEVWKAGSPGAGKLAAGLPRLVLMRSSLLYITQAVGVLERLRAACGSNVGAGHLAGWLGAALSTL